MGIRALSLIVTTALRRNGQRTLLAILAVGIGIAAVIATAALGSGGAAAIERQIDSLGEDFLWIRGGNRNVAGVRTGSGGARSLTADDARALAAEVPELTACSPRVTGREQIIAAGENWNTSFRGVSADFFQIRKRDVVLGVPFGDFDVAQYGRVLVLGPEVAERLFGEENPIGSTVRMRGGLYRVVGVLESKGTSRAGLDRDDVVYLPFSTARRSLERQSWVDDIMCSVSSPEAMERAELQASGLLRIRHRLTPEEPDDFEIQKPIEMLELRAETANTLGLLLTAIGTVSLIVGGIGIMNIMLVSVTERRREIGIRLATGARVRDIRRQFLLEAMFIGLAGGVAGIGLGWAAGSWLGVMFGTEVTISSDLIVGVTAAAIGAGLLFGYLPAYRASSLDPIQAMQAET